MEYSLIGSLVTFRYRNSSMQFSVLNLHNLAPFRFVESSIITWIVRPKSYFNLGILRIISNKSEGKYVSYRNCSVSSYLQVILPVCWNISEPVEISCYHFFSLRFCRLCSMSSPRNLVYDLFVVVEPFILLFPKTCCFFFKSMISWLFGRRDVLNLFFCFRFKNPYKSWQISSFQFCTLSVWNVLFMQWIF